LALSRCRPASTVCSFHAPATTELYTLSLHDALPISLRRRPGGRGIAGRLAVGGARHPGGRDRALPDPAGLPGAHRARAHGYAQGDRKSTRLNSSHVKISYAVFCLKKKKIRRELNASA